jgi:cytochrome d ubiquinol oxidase subunit II
MMETFWFWVIAWMLSTYVVLDGLDIGAGILHLFAAKTDKERSQILQSVGPIWDGNEVWLLAAGGTLFLAFPRLLATAFSGFYLPLMMVLWLLIFRALGIELQHQLEDPLWRRFWDVSFAVSSLLLAVFFGAALGNVIRGVPLNAEGIFFEPLWINFKVEEQTGILDWYTILIGLLAASALAYHGALWLAFRTEGAVRGRAKQIAQGLWIVVILLSIIGTTASFKVQPYLRESLGLRPWGLSFAGLALAGLAFSFYFTKLQKAKLAFAFSSFYLYGMMGCAAIGLYPYVLPARIPEYGLKTVDTAAAMNGLISALYWWIPGMMIAVGYSIFVYSVTHPKSAED